MLGGSEIEANAFISPFNSFLSYMALQLVTPDSKLSFLSSHLTRE